MVPVECQSLRTWQYYEIGITIQHRAKCEALLELFPIGRIVAAVQTTGFSVGSQKHKFILSGRQDVMHLIDMCYEFSVEKRAQLDILREVDQQMTNGMWTYMQYRNRSLRLTRLIVKQRAPCPSSVV